MDAARSSRPSRVDLRSQRPRRGPGRGSRAGPPVVARHRRPGGAGQLGVRGPGRRRRPLRSARVATSGEVAGDRPGRRRRAGTGARAAARSATSRPGPDGGRLVGVVPTRSGVEAGLLDAADWVAAPITLPDDPGAHAPGAVAAAAATFDARRAAGRRPGCTSPRSALHDVAINGQPVSSDLLAPGWTAYRHRLLADTYDVDGPAARRAGTSSPPRSATAGTAGAWAGSRSATARPTATRSALIAQLELTDRGRGSRRTIATDDSWRASTGEIRSADLYDGSRRSTSASVVAGWDVTGSTPDGAWPPAARAPVRRCRRSSRASAPPVRRRSASCCLPTSARDRRRPAARRRPEHRRARPAARPGSTRRPS